MKEKTITIAYRITHGKAKQYSYVGAKLYRAKQRKDGVYTWRPVKELGPDRRSYNLAFNDAKAFSKKMHIAYMPGIRLGSLVK
jgi:hypothetical protein